MPSQQEQAAVQALANAYVVAHQRALLSETDVLHQYGLQLFSHSFLWYFKGSDSGYPHHE